MRLSVGVCTRPAVSVALQTLSEGTRGVHADEPVAHGAKPSGISKAVQIGTGAEILERRPNRLLCHGLQPKTLLRLRVELGELHNAAEDQLTFATGITGVDDAFDVFALAELADRIHAPLLPIPRLDVELVRHDRQVLDRPASVLRVVVFGLGELQQVAHCPGDDEIVILQIVAFAFLKTTQRSCNIARYTRFLADDQLLAQWRYSLGVHSSPHSASLGRLHVRVKRAMFMRGCRTPSNSPSRRRSG